VGVQPYFCAGEMAERSIAAVLKTVEGNTSGGSNPSLSAKAQNKKHQKPANSVVAGFFIFVHKQKNSKKGIMSVSDSVSGKNEQMKSLTRTPQKHDNQPVPKVNILSKSPRHSTFITA
jgi:hypothetical protein